MAAPATAYGVAHPLTALLPQDQRTIALGMLRRKLGLLPARVWSVDVDRIAYEDHEHHAKTAYLVCRDGLWIIGGIVDGWPVDA